MYRALYAYKSSLPQYISFQAGDKFTLIDSSRNDWFVAQNGIGEVGYIPANYVGKLDVAPSAIIKFIDGSIEAIHWQASSTGTYDNRMREALECLILHRSTVIDDIQHHSLGDAEPSQSASGSGSNQHVADGSVIKDAVNSVTETQTNSVTDIQVNSATDIQHNSVTDIQVNSATDIQHNSVTDIQHNSVNDIQVNSATDIQHNSVTEVQDNLVTDAEHNLVNDSSENQDSCLSTSVNKVPGAVSFINTNDLFIPDDLGAQVVEQIRANTALSHQKSKTAVEIVLGYIGLKVPQLADIMDKIYSTVQTEHSVVGHDAVRLEVIFSELKACKDDSQQRGWALHEDESVIMEYLEELLSILENAKLSVTREAISEERYEIVHHLVQYYQMETRLKIRLLLLKVFGVMCGLDKKVITTLLFSVLPLELAQEIRSKSEDTLRLCHVTLLLTMIFSTGEPVPANIHDHIDGGFLGYLLSLIEDPPTPEHSEDASDLLINLILAINLHFDDIQHNLVMETLSTQHNCKVLTEKVMLFFNRGDDPVHMFDYKPQPEQSVMKFMQDLYSNRQTADLLYTSDALVLIDVIIRQLADLSAGDPMRTSYLKLTSLVLQNSNYNENRHRHNELYSLLHAISEEDADTQKDKDLCLSILLHNSSAFT
ncbi:NCK-interacting protein with SH3 domain-like [Gigantopelta aegis]|uniref:NCK-interacting protein with SH3 domain-like n=1 Tax=Gigantopelta aegis TaxID=1735272 RepID=UPI001B88958E|nr:NCK-interacting protein with SH3 domain-like [Gigantopelta aegis]